MSNKKNSFGIIEFLGKKTNWDSWSEKFLLHGKRKGYKKLLVSTGTTPGADKIVTQDEYESALEGNKELKMKSEFHNSKLELNNKDPNELISHLEGLRIHMNQCGHKGNLSDEIL